MEKERKKLLKNQGSTLYDVTAWSLSHAYGTDSYYTEVMPKISLKPFQAIPNKGKLIGKDPRYGWAVKSDDDQFYHLVGKLLENKMLGGIGVLSIMPVPKSHPHLVINDCVVELSVNLILNGEHP